MTITVGLDIGTTGARALAVNRAGKVVAQAAASYPLSSPRPGWAEQDPELWWGAAQQVLSLVASDVDGHVDAIGLTGQMHGAVFLDEDEQVIRPALLWNDQRTEAQCREITELIGKARLLEVTGNPALTGFQAPKIIWLREEEPDNFRRVAHVLLPKDFVRLRLCGEYATDASDAAGTLLLDLSARDWSHELLDALELPSDWFPRVNEGPEVTGHLSANAAAATGLKGGASVIAGGGDNAAAAIGIGVIEDGVSASIGTSGVMFAPTPSLTRDPSGRVHAFCHAAPGGYHLMGVTLSAGGSLRWWSDVIDQHDYDRLAELAATAPPGSEGLLFLPYLMGERTPHMDALARGAFFGLSGRHNVAHMTRAVMEGVVYSLADCFDAIRQLGLEVSGLRVTGGGARSALWRQLQADIFGLPVYRTVIDEGPAYGAALMAGVPAGVFASVQDASSVVEILDVSEPDPERNALYRDYQRVYRELYPATASAMRSLSDHLTHR